MVSMIRLSLPYKYKAYLAANATDSHFLSFPVSLCFFAANMLECSWKCLPLHAKKQESMSDMTPKQFLKHIKKNVFKGTDLAPVTTLQGDDLRTFTLEQLERLRATVPDGLYAVWLSDQFWTCERDLTMITETHPWLAYEWEMKEREQLPDLSDDEYHRVPAWAISEAEDGTRLVLDDGEIEGEYFWGWFEDFGGFDSEHHEITLKLVSHGGIPSSEPQTVTADAQVVMS